MKKIKKIVCLILACALIVNCVPNISEAASTQARWSLFFDPSQPSQEWTMYSTKDFTTSRTLVKVYIDSMTSHTRVATKILDYSALYEFSSPTNYSVTDMPVGRICYVYAKISEHINRLTSSKGHVFA